MAPLRKMLRKGAAGRRKSGEENVRSLTKTGGGRSYTVSLPVATIRAFGWQERQKLTLVINPRRKTILIKDWSR
ncbi:MAG: hypothetical protein Q7S95_03325 [bacterium]|nr:hypothetical protein [bacterium]